MMEAIAAFKMTNIIIVTLGWTLAYLMSIVVLIILIGLLIDGIEKLFNKNYKSKRGDK